MRRIKTNRYKKQQKQIAEAFILFMEKKKMRKKYNNNKKFSRKMIKEKPTSKLILPIRNF
jgi:hypothetical protein